ncbi:MAG: RNA-guided endonuclease InsQ/TnpB family protein [Candidatus Hermodarchaeota archaeon]
MFLTRKILIQPTAEQEAVLWELAECCRLVYNHALFERKFVYENYGVDLSYVDQANGLPLLKQLFPRYVQVYSKVLQNTLKKLDTNYKSFFGLRKKGDQAARPPRFRGRTYFFTLNYNQSGFTFTPTTLTLSHKHPSKTKLLFDIVFDFTTAKVKQVELFQDHLSKQFYVSVVYEVETPAYVDNRLYQAWDLGVSKHVGVNLQGKFIESTVKRPDKYWEPKIQALQSRRDHCKKGSRRWRKFHQRIQYMKRKSKNQTAHWQHCQAKNIVENTKANTIIVGDLTVKQMAQNKKNGAKQQQPGLNRATQNTGHLTRFIELLTYKAAKVGKRVIIIDERDTSKTCYQCGQKQAMPLYQRIYLCECGNQMDRDQNAAVNIMVRFLSRHAMRTGYQDFLDNLRHFFDSQPGKREFSLAQAKVGANSQEAPPM